VKAFVVSDYLLSLKLVGGYNVCNRHNLLFVNGKEILWNVLKGRGDRGHRLTHTEEGMFAEEPRGPGGGPQQGAAQLAWADPRQPSRSGSLWEPGGDPCPWISAPLTGWRPLLYMTSGAGSYGPSALMWLGGR